MASQAKTIEAKKDEFRAYLEKTGVVDQLTRSEERRVGKECRL